MTAEVKSTLLAVRKERGFKSAVIFLDENGQTYKRVAASMAFHRACIRDGTKDVRFHDLMHDFASTVINNGGSLYQVQHALSQKDPRMAARYAHLLDENKNVVNFVKGKGTATILLQWGRVEILLMLPENWHFKAIMKLRWLSGGKAMKAKALRLPDNLLDAVKFDGKRERLDEPTAPRKFLRLGAEKYAGDGRACLLFELPVFARTATAPLLFQDFCLLLNRVDQNLLNHVALGQSLIQGTPMPVSPPDHLLNNCFMNEK